MRVKSVISPFLLPTLMLVLSMTLGYAQNNFQDEYLKTKQQKNSFDNNKYNGLKEKLNKESGGQNAKGGTFNADNFSTESPSEGDHYSYSEEEYKGEYESYDAESQESNQPNKVDSQNKKEGSNADGGDFGYDYFEKEYNQDSYEDYKNSNPEKTANAKAKQKNKTKIKEPKAPTSGEMQLMQIVLICLGAVLVAFLIYYFFLRYNVNEEGKKITPEADFHPMEIPKTELERRLEIALKNANYKEAVRIYFIFIIKDLNEKDWIVWEKDKTNYSYLLEMKGKSQYSLFNESVFIFEWVWYGNYLATETHFKKWEVTFKKLLSEINT